MQVKETPSVEELIERFREFCDSSDCAHCQFLQYKDRGERYACAIAWEVARH